MPISTLTATPDSVPVSPSMLNPVAFSAMLIALSPAIVWRFSTSAPAACTLTVKSTAASL